jgi:ParB family chromosome partitioning protein
MMRKDMNWLGGRSGRRKRTNGNEAALPGSTVLQIPTADLRPNRAQPRREFEQNAMIRLADSIGRYGILQPLSVRACPDEPGRYEVVAGERRLRAAQMLGLETVPCVLCAADDGSAAELAIVENLLREDLNPFEQAEGFRLLIDRHGLTQDEVARRLSLSQSAVANKLRLLKLSEREREEILKNGLTERHARTLLRLPDEAGRLHAMEQIVRMRLNVAETEAYVDKLLALAQKPTGPSAAAVDPTGTQQRIASFRDHLGRMVESLRRSGADVQSDQEETEDAYVIRIRVPKNGVSATANDGEDIGAVGVRRFR